MRSKIKLSITGRNINYFLNLLINKNILIEVISKSRNKLVILTDIDNYEKIKKIKTSYKIRVINVYGLLYIKHLLKAYLFFIICFFISIGIIIFSSKLIFSIDVVSSNNNLNKTILEDLKVRGISKYKFKVSFNKKTSIINEILDEENDTIEWLELEEYGTKYIVNVVERKKNNNINTCNPSNIIAKKDALVTSISASSGEVTTAINRYVKKGDVLISGIIHNKEDIVNIKCSQGKVLGEVWYQVHVDLPKHYREENVTGKSYKRLGIEFFNYASKSKYKTYKSRDINILNSKLLPIRLYYTEYLETEVTDINYTIDTIDKYAIEMATKKLKQKLSKEDRILVKKILKKDEKNSRIIVGVFFKVQEDITSYEEIKEELPTGE